MSLRGPDPRCKSNHIITTFFFHPLQFSQRTGEKSFSRPVT